MIDLDDYPVKAPDVFGKIVDTDAVLVLARQGQVKVLNEVGARIWSLVDGTINLRDIAEIIFSEYQTERNQAQKDTIEFVNQMIQLGILKIE